ncbi:hypothetical protein [Cohnella nanjingensis]|uniref:DUF3939 domain-containing protein n=1 Tax=Cohnella nanjingensis TaxID=1387779 RepID=A0A7X0VIY2_9BACL|nr:hypothetical protein [Cohnella nanjingensis]MBB6674154.1 hypothetical protein [Cohnella nanjingensis]
MKKLLWTLRTTKTGRLIRTAALALCALALVPLSGCLYPDDQTPGNRASAREAVQTVQDAVDRYQQATGVLPMMNADESTPRYEKFKLDFAKMKRMGYVSTLPKLAFENGGSNQFLIVDEETKPTVKLLDIPIYQGVGEVQAKVTAYAQKNGGALPADEEVYPGFKYVDFKKLAMREPKLRSMYSGRALSLIVDDKGRVYADYGIDLTQAIEKSGATPGADEDLRERLADESYYVPVKSPVYRWVDGSVRAVAES